MEQGSTGNLFRGAGEQAYSFEDLGSPAKKEKKLKILPSRNGLTFVGFFLKSYLASGSYCLHIPL